MMFTLSSCRLYQKALKNGDPTAQKLMEALLQKPHASQALTQTLSNVRYAMTEDDTLDDVMRIWDRCNSTASVA